MYPKKVPPIEFERPIARQSKREKKAALAMQQQKGKAKDGRESQENLYI